MAAQTSTQRGGTFKARREAEGQKEMRGVYVTNAEEKIVKPDLRARLKRMRKGGAS